MLQYIIRRLLLLPITLFFIIIVNFIIINLAPGDPVTLTEISPDGGDASRKEDQSFASGSDTKFLQFREHYGLTLPILFNTWSMLDLKHTEEIFSLLIKEKPSENNSTLSLKEYENIRITFGDQARFVMPHLLQIMENKEEKDPAIKQLASQFFIRGGTRQAFLGIGLTEKQKILNKEIAIDNDLLRYLSINHSDNPEKVENKIKKFRKWYEERKDHLNFEKNTMQKVSSFFFETRFCKYMQRVLTLDFGSLRNDDNKKVINEVTKRFKYSLTLAVFPMLITFILCQLFGFLMAIKQNQWPDISLNVLFLILYAIPVFVVAPFLIEKVALNGTFPFSDIPIPFSGFTSSEPIYESKNSISKLFDILQHIFLPLVAIMYGSLAAQTRLSRTAVLEVLRQDYVRTAKAKGEKPFNVLFKHVGRNAAITIITSLAGSLGVILGGSLIVETMFEINGFGKFFYDAVINRDYNVIMFSTLSGSFLTLMGYLFADIMYMFLDPRITLD